MNIMELTEKEEHKEKEKLQEEEEEESEEEKEMVTSLVCNHPCLSTRILTFFCSPTLILRNLSIQFHLQSLIRAQV
jgi:hypothetical protein